MREEKICNVKNGKKGKEERMGKGRKTEKGTEMKGKGEREGRRGKK